MSSDSIQPDGWRLTFGRLLAALSPALDLVAGHPNGHALRTCVISLRIGSTIKLSSSKLRQLYYAAFLKDAGASTAASRFFDAFGENEVDAKKSFWHVAWSSGAESLQYFSRYSTSPQGRPQSKSRLKPSVNPRAFWHDVIKDRALGAHDALGEIRFDASIPACVRAIDECWEGSGGPSSLSGDSIPLLARILSAAQHLDIFMNETSLDDAYERLEKGSWRRFDPNIVVAAQSFQKDEEFWQQVKNDPKEILSEYEIAYVKDIEAIPNLDPVCRAYSKIIDAKSSFGKAHSLRVSQSCIQIGQSMGLKQDSLRLLSRAALLHDLGKLAVPNYLLDKKSALSEDEMERLRKHPLRTLQLLAHIPGFRRLASVASSNSERLDGSGFHRGVGAEALDQEMRILQVADVFDALTNDAPRRPAMSADQAFTYLEKSARDRFDQDCVAALKSTLSGSAPLPVIVDSDRDVVPVRHGAMAQSAA